MTRRELSECEKNFMRKQIERMKKELIHLDYLERYTSLLINEGMYYNYLEKLEEMKVNRQQIINDITITHQKINILLEQIEKGVEIKVELLPAGVG